MRILSVFIRRQHKILLVVEATGLWVETIGRQRLVATIIGTVGGIVLQSNLALATVMPAMMHIKLHAHRAKYNEQAQRDSNNML
jgi:hypothetical protein